jgi:glycosyltransferase involved in cell wall biosynthesis
MRIGIVSSSIPLVRGGYRFFVDWLAIKLREAGHEVETIYIPSTDAPDSLLQQMMAFRMLDLSAFDLVITGRPPAHVVSHPNKVIWFIHHIRAYYDLWGTKYGPLSQDLSAERWRETLIAADTAALSEARKMFANSDTVRQRLLHFNGIKAEVLYPPVLNPSRFRASDWGDEIVYVARLEPHKRQHLAIEAMQHVQTPVRLRLVGTGSASYVEDLHGQLDQNGLRTRVSLSNEWTDESGKAEAYAKALANLYIPFDEDSYGYSTIEAAHASKATISTNDAGGVPNSSCRERAATSSRQNRRRWRRLSIGSGPTAPWQSVGGARRKPALPSSTSAGPV